MGTTEDKTMKLVSGTNVSNSQTGKRGTIMNGLEFAGGKWVIYEVETSDGIETWPSICIVIR